MKIFRLRRKRPATPPGYRPPSSIQNIPSAGPADPDRPSYDQLHIDSAIVRYLEIRKPSGATIPELVLALGFEREPVETAVADLARREIAFKTTDGKVLLGVPPCETQKADQ